MRTALYIHADDSMDLGDVVNIARSEAKKALDTQDSIQVLDSFRYQSDFVVVVESEKSFSPAVVADPGKKESVGSKG